GGALQFALEAGRERGDAERRRSRRGIGLAGGERCAKEEEAVARFDQIAVVQLDLVDARAADEGAVLGALVLEQPASEHAADEEVLLRQPAVVEREAQPRCAALLVALGPARTAAGDHHVDALERMAAGRRERVL